jgi:hypothetical protein
LTPNDPYRGRTAPLNSKRWILYIYSTNVGTEYFEHGIYSPIFFSSKCRLFHNSNVFGSCIIHILYIYSTNIGTEYFKHGIYSHFFSSSKCSLFHNSNVFGSCIIHILYIYSTNVGTEYFKHGIYSPFFPLQNAVWFIILTYLVPVLFTFYIQSVLKLSTAPLSSKRCILYIYSTNIGTGYFKHGIYSAFFTFQNAVCFIILTYVVPVLFTVYLQSVLKLSTSPLSSKRCILYIYSTNIGTE